ncbi:MAG TPA: GNAT family N-acetyltransferase [Anaerolineaceae bacterium]|nr:GNAT family N-acetyltransferase [Anaerolineaceae bacterium]
MITFKFVKSEDRSIALDEAGKEVGECCVTVNKKYWSIDHTYVNPNNRGQGIAQGLLEAVVEAAKKANVKLQPVCSYAVKAFQENPEYQAIQYQNA